MNKKTIFSKLNLKFNEKLENKSIHFEYIPTCFCWSTCVSYKVQQINNMSRRSINIEARWCWMHACTCCFMQPFVAYIGSCMCLRICLTHMDNSTRMVRRRHLLISKSLLLNVSKGRRAKSP